MRKTNPFLLALILLTVGGCCFNATRAGEPPTAAHGEYRVARVMEVGGEGRWDYVAFDPTRGPNRVHSRLFVPRQTHTQVLRADTGEVIGDLKETPGVHGVALVPDGNLGFTSNGKGNSVTIFDLKALTEIGTVPVGENPDAILYDPASTRVLVFNGKSNDVTFLQTWVKSWRDTPDGRIALDGKPEFAATDGKGRVYVNIEDKNAVAVIDTKERKVVEEWKIEGGESPSGLAIDVARGRLFAGCENQVMAVIDTKTGKTLATVPIGKGVDACAFDPGTGEAFASCGDGTLTVAKETAPGKFEVTQTVKTRPGARTMALDPTTHTIYLPTADLGEPAAGGNGRPTPKPGTFKIVVVSPAEKP